LRSKKFPCCPQSIFFLKFFRGEEKKTLDVSSTWNYKTKPQKSHAGNQTRRLDAGTVAKMSLMLSTCLTQLPSYFLIAKIQSTPTNAVHVKNISSQASEKTVTDFFGFCGKITSITLLKYVLIVSF